MNASVFPPARSNEDTRAAGDDAARPEAGGRLALGASGRGRRGCVLPYHSSRARSRPLRSRSARRRTRQPLRRAGAEAGDGVGSRSRRGRRRSGAAILQFTHFTRARFGRGRRFRGRRSRSARGGWAAARPHLRTPTSDPPGRSRESTPAETHGRSRRRRRRGRCVRRSNRGDGSDHAEDEGEHVDGASALHGSSSNTENPRGANGRRLPRTAGPAAGARAAHRRERVAHPLGPPRARVRPPRSGVGRVLWTKSRIQVRSTGRTMPLVLGPWRARLIANSSRPSRALAGVAQTGYR